MVTDERFLKSERAFEAFAADVLGRVRVWAARDPSAVDASTYWTHRFRDDGTVVRATATEQHYVALMMGARSPDRGRSRAIKGDGP